MSHAKAFKKRMTTKKREALRELLHSALDRCIDGMFKKQAVVKFRHAVVVPSPTLYDRFSITLERDERLPPPLPQEPLEALEEPTT